MRARLKVKLLRWKRKLLDRTKENRLLKARLVRKRQRIKALEAEVTRLKRLVEPIPVENHVYPAQLIALAVFIVVQAKGSLRCAAKAVGFVAQIMGWDYSVPSHVTVRRWVLRCGLYLLDHTKDKVGEYVGIIDESIQIGREKMLLLLGVRIDKDRSHCAPLTMDDVEVLGVEVQQSWTGEEVAQFIKERLAHHNQITMKYVISDRGTNLLKALCILGLSAVSDCTHWMMNVVKSLFSKDEALAQLVSQIGQLRSRCALTDKGFLLPPSLRDKDRFLRIFTIVEWADRMDSYWKKLAVEQRRVLGLLRRARPLIRALRQVKALVVIASQVLKSAGLSAQSRQLWEQRVAQFRKGKRLTTQAKSFIQSIGQYFDQHQELVQLHERLLCCSDIIESTFGHYKNKGGTAVISADVLGLTLYKQPLTPDFVVTALTTVSRKHVETWEQRYTCDNRYSLLKRMNRELKSAA
jgi:hypothetical protein